MCRLLGFLTAQDESAAPWLVTAPRSLLAQSNVRPEVAQRDGWGIGWYAEHHRPRIEKGVGGAFEPDERRRFEGAASAARPPLVIGHLRHASNPLGLPREQLIGPANSQPFESHATLFAHNGSIPFPKETLPYLGPHASDVKGVNDSEVLFWLLQRHVDETSDPLEAYVRSVGDLVRVWGKVGRPAVAPFSGLNVLYAPSPEELWAFCRWNGEHGTGLLDTSHPYYEMTYRATPRRVLVGSEPFDSDSPTWNPLPNGTYLHARKVGAEVEVRTGTIPAPQALTLASASS